MMRKREFNAPFLDRLLLTPTHEHLGYMIEKRMMFDVTMVYAGSGPSSRLDPPEWRLIFA